MTALATTGLFRAPVLTPSGRKRFHAFFKPADICLYSGPPPIQMRVVTYRMLCWLEDQPRTTDDIALAKRFVRQPDRQASFSFTTGVMPHTPTSLLPSIQRHFTTQVLQHKRVYNSDTALSLFHGRNTAKFDTVLPTGQGLELSRVTHLTRMRLTKELDYVTQGSVLRYHVYHRDVHGDVVFDNRTNSSALEGTLEYNDHRHLMREALRHYTNEVASTA